MEYKEFSDYKTPDPAVSDGEINADLSIHDLPENILQGVRQETL